MKLSEATFNFFYIKQTLKVTQNNNETLQKCYNYLI